MHLDSPFPTLSEQLAAARAEEAAALLRVHHLRRSGRSAREVESAIHEVHARHGQVARLQLQLRSLDWSEPTSSRPF